MGRPLNKKFFGNRNIGTGGYQINGNLSNSENYADDRIGGEGIQSVLTLSTPGNYINRLPTIASLGAPTIANGVQAAGVLHSVAQSASPSNAGTGYYVGDVLTDANGSTWRVTALTVVGVSLDPAHQGANYAGDDTIPYANGLQVNLDGVNGGGTPTGQHVADGGTWTTTGAGPANSGAQIPGLGGTGAQFLLTWGIKELAPVTSIDYAYGTTYLYNSSNVVTGGHGANGALNVGFSPSYIALTNKGSGYATAPAITFTTAPNGGEVRAVGTTNLTVDTGNVGSATYQENAIIAYAYIDGALREVDIVRQVSTDRYKVDATGYTTRIGRLQTTLADGSYPYAEGVEMNIVATDSANGSYFVKKLTARKAVLVPADVSRLGLTAGTLFAPEIATPTVFKSIPWNFTGAVGTASVKIENA